MHEAARFRPLLVKLRSVLEQQGGYGADAIEGALNGSDADVEAFLISNILWGGAGSIADQAGSDRTSRRPIEAVLIELGEEQARVGKTNERSDMWVEAFRRWQRDG